jgi:hypothetical protein
MNPRCLHLSLHPCSFSRSNLFVHSTTLSFVLTHQVRREAKQQQQRDDTFRERLRRWEDRHRQLLKDLAKDKGSSFLEYISVC